jgi:hypothetical protein
MKATRVLTCLFCLVAAVGVLTGCKKGPSKEELKLTEMKQLFATLQPQAAELEQARAQLAAAEAAAATITAVEESKRTPEQKTLLAQTNATIATLTSDQDGKYEALQTTLADLLNIGLNDFRRLPRPSRRSTSTRGRRCWSPTTWCARRATTRRRSITCNAVAY